MYRIAVSTNGKEFNEGLFESFGKSGVEAMEISLTKDGYDAFDYENARRMSEKYGVELWSLHLPFMPFSVLDISNEEICESTLKYLFGIMEKAAGIGISRFIIHPSGEPISDGDRAKRLDTAKKSLARLAEKARSLKSVIAVEDLPRTCLGRNSDEMSELLCADKDLRVCLDTNHLLSEDLTDFIHKVGDKIITTHVSDYDFIDEKHWLPGEGNICWQSVINALRDAGYGGVWLYEVAFKAPPTVTRSRDLTAEDFVKNAKEIFENRPITVVY